MSKLFEPITIKDITLKNRIVVSPMCQYSSKNGMASDWHLVHLGSRAVGGAALIIQEATAVSPEGRITPDDMGLWSDDHITPLKKIIDFVHNQDCLIGLQLAHAGRKASISNPWSGGKLLSAEQGGWQREAPSPISFQEGAVPPHEMTESDINKVIDDFRTAADRSLKAGYDVVEIHAAHGYLLHEFLSPLTNHRTDAYGGSFENRIRLVLEVVKAVKQSWPESKPLFLRISASDWAEGGWPTDEAVELSKILKEKGVDVLDCSSGGLVLHQKIPVTPGYQVPFSDLIRKEAGALTAAVGLITTAKQAEQILEEDKADLIFIAREFLRDPYFPIHAAKELGVDIKWPVKYERAK